MNPPGSAVCVLRTLKQEGRTSKRPGRFLTYVVSNDFSSFILHPSSFILHCPGRSMSESPWVISHCEASSIGSSGVVAANEIIK
jgi:hypothetical protein